MTTLQQCADRLDALARRMDAIEGGHLHLSATPQSSTKSKFAAKASNHSEIEKHLGTLHRHIKSRGLEPYNVSINNTRTGEVHHAKVAPHGIYKRTFNAESF